MKNGFDYYRIKTEWTAERKDGCLAKIKTEELVLVSSYTEADKVAYEIAENQNRMQFSTSINVEIVKTKIREMLCNSTLCHDNDLTAGLICNYFEEGEDTGVGLYAVKVMYLELDEKTGKEKRSNDTIYTPAISNIDAFGSVERFLQKNEMRDFVIRDTKFDKAEAIFWSPEVHKEKLQLSEQF
jgi:hypothetical protein